MNRVTLGGGEYVYFPSPYKTLSLCVYSTLSYLCMYAYMYVHAWLELSSVSCLIHFVFSFSPLCPSHLGFSLYLTDDYPSCSIHSLWYVCKLVSTVLFFIPKDSTLRILQCFKKYVGVYGDVVRVKILYNKRDSALIQFKEPQHAQTGT